MADTASKDNYFKLDSEAHIWPDTSDIKYFPGFQWEHPAFQGVTRILGISKQWETKGDQGNVEFPKANEPETLIERMDKYGVDMACVVPESGWGKTHIRPITTNGYIMAACEKFPDRLIFTANVGPITARGIDHALWEVEYLVKNKNCKMVKMYTPEDTYIDDKQLWPFYKKVSDLGVPIALHTGWCWVPPNLSKYCLTWQLDEVATTFPDLKIVAYHAGWPSYHEMNMIAAVHPNVYVGLSVLLSWCITAPRRAAEIIGEAVQFASADKVVWGTDYCNSDIMIKYAAEGFRDFQIPKDLQEGYGFSPLSEEDKKKIFGLNMAKLLGIEPKRRVPQKK
jgi:predicted TIM-barrel fold metal-dependent hydrolase